MKSITKTLVVILLTGLLFACKKVPITHHLIISGVISMEHPKT
jgi:hypothetical protein